MPLEDSEDTSEDEGDESGQSTGCSSDSEGTTVTLKTVTKRIRSGLSCTFATETHLLKTLYHK